MGNRPWSEWRLLGGGGSPTWQSFVWVDIGEQEPETLEEIDPHWRAMHWLQVAVQGITDEVPWYKLVTPLTSGVEGMALSLAKCLVTRWWLNLKVHGEDDYPPALSVLNIGQFIMDEEVAGDVGEPHWFIAYSHTLQQVGEVACRRKWEWSRRETLEIKASPLVHAFWCETDIDLTMASVKLCWEPTPRALYHQRDNGPTVHVISYLDELAVCVPTLEAWDQMYRGGYPTCNYRGRVIWLLSGPGSRSRPCDASGTILGHKGRRGLPVHCESPGV